VRCRQRTYGRIQQHCALLKTADTTAFGSADPKFAFLRVHLSRRSYCAKVDSWLVSLRMREFLEFVIRQLIEFPDDMVLTEIPSGRTTVFKLQLRRGDVGRVIGRGGQTIQAIRALLASSAARHGQRAILEIVE
jgi:uncharacterized protein